MNSYSLIDCKHSFMNLETEKSTFLFPFWHSRTGNPLPEFGFPEAV
jgi:hypothetical protein